MSLKAPSENDVWVVALCGLHTFVGRVPDTERHKTSNAGWTPSILHDALCIHGQFGPVQGRKVFSVSLMPFGPCEAVVPVLHLGMVGAWSLVSTMSESDRLGLAGLLEQISSAMIARDANEAGIILPGQLPPMGRRG